VTAAGPIVVVGAHVQGLFMYVHAIAGEGESVLGWGYDEPADGGKATNQAVAAARLGAPTSFVSVVGRDERGRRALDSCRTKGLTRGGSWKSTNRQTWGLSCCRRAGSRPSRQPRTAAAA
jgi:sugar/nucleoside kinase (ribokinase family)